MFDQTDKKEVKEYGSAFGRIQKLKGRSDYKILALELSKTLKSLDLWRACIRSRNRKIFMHMVLVRLAMAGVLRFVNTGGGRSCAAARQVGLKVELILLY